MDDFMIDKSKTVCFSGHRPEKLPFSGDENTQANKMLKSLIYKEIEDCIDDGCDCFITGLARGFDLWAGNMVLRLKLRRAHIKLVAAFPYRGFTNQYKGYDKWICGNIISEADAKFYISEKYDKLCMRERNYFMVDNSSKLIAALSDNRSGTGQTVRYAQKQGIEIKLFDLNKISEEYKEIFGGYMPTDELF
ncbi:MAG: SLOG family protein [Oscillospiraceae bacterium]|nr:SLOG family protein [Oscillospiraceae bacterium]